MLLFPFLCFLQSSLGCLSKHKPSNDAEIITRRMFASKDQKRQMFEARYKRKIERRNISRSINSITSFAKQINAVETNFSSCFGSDIILDDGIKISDSDTFEEKKRLTTFWIAVTNSGHFETIMEYLRVCELNGAKPIHIERDNLVRVHFLLFLNAKLSKVTEETIPEFASLLKFYSTLLYQSEKEALRFEAANADEIKNWTTKGRVLMSEFCHSLIMSVLSFAKTFDADLEMIRQVEVNPGLTYIRFEWLYANICDMETITSAKLQDLFEGIADQRNEWNQVNNQIKADFYEMLEGIKEKMDSQFADQSPEDLILESDEAELIPVEVLKEQISKPVEIKEELTPVSALGKTKHSREEQLKKHKENKEQREKSKILRSKLKHEAHLAKIQDVTEDDDKDITLYYSTRNAGANRVYRQNQDAQVCKMAFAKADRFQHSIYPEITASGETINFLCSLLVSGTPTYEGFLAAHKDLGGVFVEKKNGNKLFFFNEPISYHKTLHAPHLSSRFDHVLYRRFYRNCALHPYFFKLQE